jgi:aminoglycoside/choline kinase family phosphotransferase
MNRPDRSAEMDAFLARIGMKGAVRRMLAGDASFRRYERVDHEGRALVLMDAPPPWENVAPFMAVTELLGDYGVTVPTIHASDVQEGFLLLEDLGDAIFTRVLKAQPARESTLYLAAVDALVAINRAGAQQPAAIAPYDMAVYLREAALFVEWFLPQVMGMQAATALREDYLARWRAVLAATPLQQRTLVHRDYHADNLLWLEDREGHRTVGMLDYQDALWGDAAYDLVSLLEDARRDVQPETVQACRAHFVAANGEGDDFPVRYAVLGAQRNAKIIGIFTRLCVRDGKAHYLDYLPRVWAHFLQDLQHPALAPIRAFIEAHVPAAWRGRFAADTSIGGMAA